MTAYVLIFALWGSGWSAAAGGPAVAYFVDRLACEAAAEAIENRRGSEIIVRCLADEGGEH